MPSIVGATPGAHGSISTPARIRYGCFPARIGAVLDHRLEHNITLPESGRLLKKGGKVHLTVEDITRVETTSTPATWYCRNGACLAEGKRWKTKKELLADHPSNRDLEKEEEVHLFVGVVHTPAIEAKEEQRDKKGEIVQEQVDSAPARIVLVSDEE